jgi:hypothetical protein
MKLVKRGFSSQPLGSMTLWLIPTMSYMFGKVVGIIYHREWIWWVMIPILILSWVLLNWKIKK